MPLPNEIKLFISRYIGSIQQLEVLLTVSSEPERNWSPEEISKRLALDVTAVTNRLLSLCVKGLVRANEKQVRTSRYQPEGNVADIMVKKLASLHKEHPAPLMEFICSRAEARLRDFSDAFKLNQEEEND
jgi:DNA-binding IclR family transcriptional regulator